MVLHPFGRFAFVIKRTRLDCGHPFDTSRGKLEEIAVYPTLQRRRRKSCLRPADLCRCHFLYGANRAHDSIAIFAVGDLTGVLAQKAMSSAARRGVAKCRRNFGQRVQFSVFEIEVVPAQWTLLKSRLEAIYRSRPR